MLAFFRKIRKSLINSGSNRYLLYAVGEIALVVIGILIALQINNWNEERKNHEFERQILSELLYDLQSDTADINYQIQRFHHIKRNLQRWQNRTSQDDGSGYIGGTLGGLYFTLNTTTFETLRGKGLHSLESDELRRTISEYYRTCHWFLDMVNMTSRDFYTIYQEPFKKEHIRYEYYDDERTDLVPKDRSALLKSDVFDNFLGAKRENLDYEYDTYRRIIKLAEESMIEIQSYLEQN